MAPQTPPEAAWAPHTWLLEEKGSFVGPKTAGGGLGPHDWLLNTITKQKETAEDNLSWEVQVRKVDVTSGVNGVAMDRHGLILWENEAPGPGMVSRYLQDLREAIF